MRRQREKNFFDYLPLVLVYAAAVWITIGAIVTAVMRWL